eukprot:5272338-Amphidinium_carterae.1
MAHVKFLAAPVQDGVVILKDAGRGACFYVWHLVAPYGLSLQQPQPRGQLHGPRVPGNVC